MATVKLTYGAGSCQHVSVDITIDGETRKFSCLKNELIGEQDKDQKFLTVLSNVKTNVALSKELDISKISSAISATEFKI